MRLPVTGHARTAQPLFSLLFAVALITTAATSLVRETTVFVPDYSMGVIFERTNGWKPIGTAFFLENTQYVITARHVLFDEKTGKQRKITFAPIKNIGVSEGRLVIVKLQEAFEREDLAVLRVDGLSPCKTPLTRGNPLTLRKGDIVTYAGYNKETTTRKKVGFTLMPQQVRRIYIEDGLRYIEVEGFVRHGFSGGPLISRDSNVVGIIVQGKPAENEKWIFRAISVEHLPSLPPAEQGNEKLFSVLSWLDCQSSVLPHTTYP
jgi:S1-C subfamily serine protease